MQNYRDEAQNSGKGDFYRNRNNRNESYRGNNQPAGYRENRMREEGRNRYESGSGMERRDSRRYAEYATDRIGGGANLGGGSTYNQNQGYSGYSPEGRFGTNRQRGMGSQQYNMGGYEGSGRNQGQSREGYRNQDDDRRRNMNYGTPTNSGGRFDNDRTFYDERERGGFNNNNRSMGGGYQDQMDFGASNREGGFEQNRSRNWEQGAGRERDYLGGYTNQGGSRYGDSRYGNSRYGDSRYERGNSYSSNNGQRHEQGYGSRNYDQGRQGGYYRMSQYNEESQSRYGGGNEANYRRNEDRNRY